MSRRTWTEKHGKIIAGTAVALFVLLSVFVFFQIGRPLIRFLSEPEKFQQWLDTYGIWSRLCYMGMVALQVFFAIIPGEPFEIFGGYAFGAWEGTLLYLAAAWLGGVAVFYFVRRFGVRAVEIFFSREKLDSLKFLHSSPKKDAILFFLYSVPGTPKDLLCYFAGLTDIDARRWLIFSLVGRLPSVVTSTFGGEALSSQNYIAAIVMFAVTLVISGIGALVYYRLCSKHNHR